MPYEKNQAERKLFPLPFVQYAFESGGRRCCGSSSRSAFLAGDIAVVDFPRPRSVVGRIDTVDAFYRMGEGLR